MTYSTASAWESETAYWIDTHSHLADESCRKDPEGYLQRALDNGVGRIMAISCSMEDLEWNLALKEKHPWIDVAVGYFPEDVAKYGAQDWEKLYEAVKDPRVSAIGEIGLDYYWDKSFAELQKQCFVRQIEWANEVHKPILVHSRDAYGDTYQILREHPVEKGALMHCYSGSREMTVQYLTLPMKVWFAFGGNITYKNSKNANESALYLDRDHILTETDSPYLAPQNVRGTVNESKNVRYVGEYLSRLKGMREEELQKAVMKNYEELTGVKL